MLRIKQLPIIIGVAALSVALFQSARATMIVVIYTKDGYWLASDSYRSSHGKHVANVCKIHETRFGLVAKSGESEGVTESGEIYSTDKEVRDLLNAAQDAKTFKSDLRRLFQQEMDQELAFLVDDPNVTGQNVELTQMATPIPHGLKAGFSRTVTLFDTTVPGDGGNILYVQAQSDQKIDPLSTPYFNYRASLLAWPDVETLVLEFDSPNQISFPRSVHELAYPVSYSRTDAWIQENPKQALEELLQKGHSEKPEDIGPPYTIIHVICSKLKRPEVKWISRGACPGWSENLNRENSLTRFRDEERKSRGIH
jgi:hypothetical protein